MYDSDTYSGPPPPRRWVRWILVAVVVLIVAFVAVGQIVLFWLNLTEFGELFLRPIYYALIGGLILSPIALFRLDFIHRRSLTWWGVGLVVAFFKSPQSDEEAKDRMLIKASDFDGYKLSPLRFTLWQFAKLPVGIVFLANVLFGLAVWGVFNGWDPAAGRIWGIFALPFTTPPMDIGYAQATVLPMIPTLTLIISPLLGAVGLRLILLVGVTEIVRMLTRAYIDQAVKGHATFPAGTIQGLIALAALWSAFNFFFPSYIDFNTKYVIGALLALGVVMGGFALYDRIRGRPLIKPTRTVLLRFLAIFIIIIVASSAVAAQNSIADARKLEWRGSYTSQQIAVNRYLAELDEVKVVPYEFGINPLPTAQIDEYIDKNKNLLGNVRLWDKDGAFDKLKPQIGLIPYIDFQDSDILRFNGTLYWSASMKPILPSTVRPEDSWYTSHLVYTHIPEGFLILDGHKGTIIDTAKFFEQRRIYYGEGGLFQETWAAYPVGREVSDELGGYFYGGAGGIAIPPPLSWIFEPNFILSYPDRAIHALRYRDVYDRMKLLFPYFLYEFEGSRVDMIPVNDGADNTYWLMPLLVRLGGQNIPWSGGNPFIRLVGYALIDTIDGDIQLLITGDDYFSQLFKTVYAGYVTTEVPKWLEEQIRYPEELFEWRVNMFNYFHVTNPRTFIEAKEFFEIPAGLDTYYIMAQPPDLAEPRFVGLLSLELRGAGGRNLAGYMTIQNDYPHLGEMTFYEVALDSPTKLLGPTAVREALERNSDFATLRTLLRTPRVGDNILYRVGAHDVYFIPIYTGGAGGVVTELGAVAAVGAAFTGEYYVGLGTGGTAEAAFKEYLKKLSGAAAPPPAPTPTELTREQRLDLLKKIITSTIVSGENLTIVTPESISAPLTFLEGQATYVEEADREGAENLLEGFLSSWVAPNNLTRVLTWTEGTKVNFGAIFTGERGVVELHYISVDLG